VTKTSGDDTLLVEMKTQGHWRNTCPKGLVSSKPPLLIWILGCGGSRVDALLIYLSSKYKSEVLNN